MLYLTSINYLYYDQDYIYITLNFYIYHQIHQSISLMNNYIDNTFYKFCHSYPHKPEVYPKTYVNYQNNHRQEKLIT